TRHKSGAWVAIEGRARNYLDVPQLHGVLVSCRDVTKSVEVTETLRRSARDAEDLFRQAPCGYHAVDAGDLLLRINDTELELLGYRREELVGRRTFRELVSEADRAKYDQQAALLTKAPSAQDLELVLVRKDGAELPVLVRSVGVFDEAAVCRELRATVFDISERKRSEVALARVNAALRVLSEVRREIIHARSEKELLDDVCRVLVEQTGYLAACVHYVERDSAGTIKLISKASSIRAEANGLPVTWDADDDTLEVIGRAVESSAPQIRQDLPFDLRASERSGLLELGYKSAAALPLIKRDGVFGTLTVCAAERFAFEKEETTLLEQLSDDLSFGVGALLREGFAGERAAVEGHRGPIAVDLIETLSARERQVLMLVVEGYSSKEIARRLGVSPASIDTYRSRLMVKLDVEDLPSLVRLAVRERVIQP